MGDLPVLISDILEQLERQDMKVDEAGMSALLSHSWPGNVRQLRTIVQKALVESDGDRLMLERALAETSTDAEPERASGMYDEARRDFDRRFYTALHAPLWREPLANREGRGQAARDGEGGPAHDRLVRRYRVHQQDVMAVASGLRQSLLARSDRPLSRPGRSWTKR
jgi:transcriptional regulator of acetoin/glycerol metabolism